jgi:hypothetical protein
MLRRPHSQSSGPSPTRDNPDHRAMFLYIRPAEAARVRTRVMSVLGANQVSPLRESAPGWTMIICPKCAVGRDQKRAG